MKNLLTMMLLLLLLTACNKQEQPKYTIGISQCSADIWREKQNAELRMGAYFQGNVELKFAAAYDSDERQVQQIDSLVESGIDLLIVAPNQVQTISPAIDRAYDKGIPVIVFERKTSSRKYTALISADNYEMGHVMGEHIVNRLHAAGTILEIKGLEGSSPAIERHNGFMDAIKEAKDISVAASLQGDWTEESALRATRAWLDANPTAHVDYVFAHNDRMAMGARKALQESRRLTADGRQPLYCGIDGLPGKNGGIQLVRDSVLDASYIYPTHGDQLIDLAVRILKGEPHEKETMMQSALVTEANAKVLLMETEEMMHQSARLDQLHDKADTYLHALDNQRVINWLALSIIVLLVIVFVLFYLYHLRKVTLQRERVVNTLWNLPTEPIATAPTGTDETTDNQAAADNVADSEPAKSLLTDNKAPAATEGTAAAPAPQEQDDAPAAVSYFIAHFKEVIEKRLQDSDLSVDDLAADMSLSRVQLYRKVKAVTGSSPVELLRTARLNRAYQLLLTTDKSVSEVAYEVGFTAPSYFTKCFKEEYGMVPGEVRK